MKNVSLAPQICENDFSFFSTTPLPSRPLRHIFTFESIEVNRSSPFYGGRCCCASIGGENVIPFHLPPPLSVAFFFRQFFMGHLKIAMGMVWGFFRADYSPCEWGAGRQILTFFMHTCTCVLFIPAALCRLQAPGAENISQLYGVKSI